MGQKDFQSAIVYLSAYIQSKPKKYEAYQLRGECFYELRQYQLAQKDFEKAIELKTEDDKFLTGTKVLSAVVLGADKQSQYQNPELGNMYAQLMYAQKAQNNVAYEESLQKAFEYNSHIYLPQPSKKEITKINCPQKYGKKINTTGIDKDIYDAINLIEKEQFNEAVYKTQNITSKYPEYYLGHYLTGVAYVGLEQDQEAISAFENALNANPYDFESMASLGKIYYLIAEKTFNAESSKKSIEYFEKALIHNPNCSTYYYYIGLNYLQNGKEAEAISNFDKAIKHNKSDFNSIYYKLIAQHIAKDYDSVIEGSTNLLYRHVSNYNSVLYLRALAQYEKGNLDAAIADIEKIRNNINDIYNNDIKITSEKEKTLTNYLHYLNAKIIQDKGFGAKSELEKAYNNPIIAKLDKIKNPADKIDVDLILTYNDVDIQYDYIRTTFNDLGITFKYNEPTYLITTFSDKTNDINEQSIITVEENSTIKLKQSTDPMDTLLSEEQTSVAKILATNAFPITTQKAENSVEDFAQEQITKIEENIDNSEKLVQNLPQEISEKVEENVETSISTIKNSMEEVKANYIFEAKEQKESQDVKILYSEEPTNTEDLNNNAEANIENITTNTVEVINTTQEKVTQIVEKHANVDLKEFDIQKITPQINEGDEIVYFDPTNYIKEAGKQFEQDIQVAEANSALKSDITKITDNVENNIDNIQETSENISQDITTTQTIITDKLKSVVTPKTGDLPNEVSSSIEISENVSSVETQLQQEIVESPVVIIPTLSVPVKATEQKEIETDNNSQENIAEQIEESFEQEQKSDEIKTEISTNTEENSAEETVSSIVQSVFIGDSKDNIDETQTGIDQADTETNNTEIPVQEVKKEKKSWFSFFKRKNKKTKTEATETAQQEINQIQQDIEETELINDEKFEGSQNSISEKALSIEEQVQEKMNEIVGTPANIVNQNVNSSTPIITEENSKKEKKKFVWWWDRDDEQEIEDESNIYGLMKNFYGEDISKELGLETETVPTRTNGPKTILKEMKK